MRTVPLQEIAARCDKILRPGEFTDWPGAVNGLQAENSGCVRKIAAVVDATLATVRLAAEQGADFLLAHHGLFWSSTTPWTGKKMELLLALIENDIAVYSSHLPLDAHSKFGNNALLGRALGFAKLEPFFFEKGRFLGWKARRKISRENLATQLTRILGRDPILLPGGPAQCENIGVVTGGAGAELKIAAAEGVDTFITGEGPHWTYALAEEQGINVFYGGHYATETFGVRALAADLSKTFQIPWVFVDHPTGL